AVSAPKTDIYSCTTAAPYPSDPTEIRRLFVEHWACPVRFRETIEAMYAAGVRLFAEVGPRGNLTAFVDDILRGRPPLAVPSPLPRFWMGPRRCLRLERPRTARRRRRWSCASTSSTWSGFWRSNRR